MIAAKSSVPHRRQPISLVLSVLFSEDSPVRPLLRFSQPLLLAVTLFLTTPLARSQSTAAEVSTRLMGKPLYLRGFWAEDSLKFDAAGHHEKVYSSTSFTVAGFDLTKAEVDGDQLYRPGPG